MTHRAKNYKFALALFKCSELLEFCCFGTYACDVNGDGYMVTDMHITELIKAGVGSLF